MMSCDPLKFKFSKRKTLKISPKDVCLCFIFRRLLSVISSNDFNPFCFFVKTFVLLNHVMSGWNQKPDRYDISYDSTFNQMNIF